MKQQIIVSGLGGQGVVTLSRLLAEAALALGLPVITSETHGMAQRGGTVISMVKVGPFRGPLVPAGSADVGFFLHEKNLPVHRHYMKPQGALVVNCATPGDYLHLEALSLASGLGSPPVAANLILLGFAAGKRLLFCGDDLLEEIIRQKSPERFRERNLQAFRGGIKAAME
ncbi:MAG: 2-oxoacid:acceptor oxidoreductase family protein [Syntrophobacterales bacterium]|jgi:indolepyruvate ferredoxin oxidoreductase beta subunit